MQKKLGSLLALAGASVLAAPMAAAQVDCNGVSIPNMVSCTDDLAQRAGGVNIFPWESVYQVFEEVDIKNIKVFNGFTGELDSYRLILVRDSGVSGASLTGAAAAYEFSNSGPIQVDEDLNEQLR